MNHHARHAAIETLKTPCLVIGLHQGRRDETAFSRLDRASGGRLARILRQGDFDAACGETLMLYGIEGIGAKRLLLLGLGRRKGFSAQTFAKAVGRAATTLQKARLNAAALLVPEEDDSYALVREAILAAETALYRFDACKSEAKSPKHPLRRLDFITSDRRHLRRMQKACAHGQAIAAGTALAKDLANLPGNICTPGYLADQARKLARGKRKLKVSILEEKDMRKLGMGALLSVSRGSRQPAKLIVLEYKGGKAGTRPVTLVGKGLTFDAGGISIKPSQAMDEMKYDMCGGASVLGTLAACVELELPINVVGIIPSSENLPDGDANKPGDIVTSMSGKTIEVLNTDAEGRLILCDALSYAERFNPAAVIDIATLTGACIIALGHQASGLMGNDERLAMELEQAAEASHDRVWRLPLWDEYKDQLKSNFADLANIGGRPAGTITAAAFLSHFTESFKWAHLDIAGTAWKSGQDKGATGRPVPLLTQFLMKRCKAVD
jgi:leucyl aminopeptidase